MYSSMVHWGQVRAVTDMVTFVIRVTAKVEYKVPSATRNPRRKKNHFTLPQSTCVCVECINRPISAIGTRPMT